ncbi:H-NS family nucleoid-associated regulatory protein [Gallaecimonas sp. GXIMD4217]|uniref:H-NS histone family protein n=1 Tax=Gallaecimonas sp. GXIMD4217 TaxID=3131927 RepID=UPI00311AC6CB
MSDFLQILANQRRLNAQTKDLSVAELEEIKGKLENIIEHRREEEAERQQEEVERQRKIEEFRKAMEAAGISPDELGMSAAAPATRKGGKGVKRAPKYRIVVDGQETLWTGVGRTPRVFKDVLDKGGKLDDYLIK